MIWNGIKKGTKLELVREAEATAALANLARAKMVASEPACGMDVRLLLLCKLLWTLSRVFAIRPVEHCYIETTISFCVGHPRVAARPSRARALVVGPMSIRWYGAVWQQDVG
jgi:hypothetical protein